MWQCAKCGEQLEEQFEACWKCMTPRPVTPEEAIKSEEAIEDDRKILVESNEKHPSRAVKIWTDWINGWRVIFKLLLFGLVMNFVILPLFIVMVVFTSFPLIKIFDFTSRDMSFGRLFVFIIIIGIAVIYIPIAVNFVSKLTGLSKT
jgi:hypothetical protein